MSPQLGRLSLFKGDTLDADRTTVTITKDISRKLMRVAGHMSWMGGKRLTKAEVINKLCDNYLEENSP